MHEAKERADKELVVWGTGTPRREFLYVDDAADALVHLMKVQSEFEHVNVGCGEDISIFELARLNADVVGFEGDKRTDASRPDGTPRKLMSAGRLRELGWRHRIPLRDGIENTYQWYLAHAAGQDT